MLGGQSACRDRLVCWLVSQPRLTGRCVGLSVSRDRLSGMLVSHSAGIDSHSAGIDRRLKLGTHLNSGSVSQPR